jgi:hypothetical protein
MALPENSLGRLMPGDCWIRWDLVVRSNVIFPTVWFQVGAARSSAIFCHHGHVFLGFMVKSEVENGMK